MIELFKTTKDRMKFDRMILSELTEFRHTIQVQIHLEMPGILVQLGRIQRT